MQQARADRGSRSDTHVPTECTFCESGDVCLSPAVCPVPHALVVRGRCWGEEGSAGWLCSRRFIVFHSNCWVKLAFLIKASLLVFSPPAIPTFLSRPVAVTHFAHIFP